MRLAHSIEPGLALVARSTACRPASLPKFQVLHPGDVEVPRLQRFIAMVYARNYCARIQHFAMHLAGLRSADGSWSAGLGYTLADRDALFLEQYLERPIESVIAAHAGLAACREEIVEVGNLAAVSAGAARRLILHMTVLLYWLGQSWVVFTATPSLLNSFRRLDIALVTLADADPRRLADGGRSWGSYYDTGPRVVAANIPRGFSTLFAAADAAHAA